MSVPVDTPSGALGRSWAARLAAPLMLVAASTVMAANFVQSSWSAATPVIVSPAPGAHRLTELSGLAWDKDGGHLYAVSDRGRLYRLKADLNAKPPTLELLHSQVLPTPDGHAPDAEGLEAVSAARSPSGRTELWVATEGPPRLLRYDTSGRWLGEWPLPQALARRLGDNKAARRGNSQLEAVTDHPTHGLLVAAETPAVADGVRLHSVYGSHGHWRFAASTVGVARLKAMDILPGGRLLVLERVRAGAGRGLHNRLLEVDLDSCGGPAVCETRLRWAAPDGEDNNLEGMTVLDGGDVVLVADDRGRGTPCGSCFIALPRSTWAVDAPPPPKE